jgi:hypothetical protein
MVDTLALLGEETRVDALLVERLDQLPLHLADRGDGEALGALDRLTVFAEILRVAGVELVDFLRADPVVVDVPPHRRREIAHDDPELQLPDARLHERGRRRRSGGLACARARRTRATSRTCARG